MANAGNHGADKRKREDWEKIWKELEPSKEQREENLRKVLNCKLYEEDKDESPFVLKDRLEKIIERGKVRLADVNVKCLGLWSLHRALEEASKGREEEKEEWKIPECDMRCMRSKVYGSELFKAEVNENCFMLKEKLKMIEKRAQEEIKKVQIECIKSWEERKRFLEEQERKKRRVVRSFPSVEESSNKRAVERKEREEEEEEEEKEEEEEDPSEDEEEEEEVEREGNPGSSDASESEEFGAVRWDSEPATPSHSSGSSDDSY